MTVTFQIFSRCNLSCLVLLLGLSAGSAVVVGAEWTLSDHVKNPEEGRRRLQAEYEARPKHVQPMGIIDSVEADPTLKHLRYKNGWFGNIKGEDVYVIAGEVGPDVNNKAEYDAFDPLTSQGFVTIEKGGRENIGTPKFRSRSFDTPQREGALRIIEAHGHVLMLETPHRHKFLLNVETEQLTSLGPK